MPPATTYRGRFAPSPSGPLHFGSLLAALGSYLDAKSEQGLWLLRMEDIDPPREQPGAADSILRSLEAHGLYWDESVLYQSQRLQTYRDSLSQLADAIYPCNCNRKRLAKLDWRYDGHCLQHPPSLEHDTFSLRLNTKRLPPEHLGAVERFDDLFLGPQYWPLADQGDFVVLRKDGLFAYQLAVTVDDAYQGISHVIRGQDLLETTSRQRYLLTLMGKPSPYYGHLPLALDQQQQKLSKQNHAQPLDNAQAASNLLAALRFLGLWPDFSDLPPCEQILQWAIRHWQRRQVPKQSKAVV